jgi:hypothetical protein
MDRLYTENNFPDDDLDNCKCCICSDVVFQASGNDNCPHIFCRDCITIWAKTKNTCPSCDQQLKLSPSKYFDLTNIFNLKYHCSNNGCTYSNSVGYNYTNIIAHKTKCEHKIYKCHKCSTVIEIQSVNSNSKIQLCIQCIEEYNKEKNILADQIIQLKIHVAQLEKELLLKDNKNNQNKEKTFDDIISKDLLECSCKPHYLYHHCGIQEPIRISDYKSLGQTFIGEYKGNRFTISYKNDCINTFEYTLKVNDKVYDYKGNIFVKNNKINLINFIMTKNANMIKSQIGNININDAINYLVAN